MSQTLARAYLSASGGSLSAIAVTPKGSWNVTTSPSTMPGTPRPQGSSISTTTKTEAVTTNPNRVLMAMVISDPLAAVTGYTGTFDQVLGLLESSASADFYTSVHVWVTIGNTDVVRATLVSNYSENTTNEWPTTATGLALQSAQAIGSVSWVDGDRVVIECGFVARNAVSTSFTGTLRRGNISGNADLTAGSTAVTTQNGGFIFSPALTLAAPTNDLVTTPTVIGSLPYSVSGVAQKYATGASGSGGSQRDPYVDAVQLYALDQTLWWKYTAASTFTAHISVEGSDGPVRVAVFDLSEATLLTSAADGADLANALTPSDASPLVVNMTSGQTYYILAGYDISDVAWGTVGLLNLSLVDAGAGTPPPTNNTCGAAQAIASLPFTDTVDTTGDTSTDAGDPAVSALVGSPHNSIFYTLTLVADTYVTVSTTGSTPDSVSAAYTGACGSLAEVRSASSLTGSAFTFKALAGVTYTLMVGSITAGGGSLALSVTELVSPAAVAPGTSLCAGVRARYDAFFGNSSGAADFNYLFMLCATGGVPGLNTNGLALVSMWSDGAEIAGGVITQDDWHVRVTYPGPGGTLPYAESALNPYVSAAFGTPDPGPPRSDWGWHAWTLGVTASTYDPNTGDFADDGQITLTLDGVALITIADVAIHRRIVSDQVQIGIAARYDTDSPWVGLGAVLPSAFDSQAKPTDIDLAFFDALDADFTGWSTWDYEGIGEANARPYASPYGYGGGICASQDNGNPSDGPTGSSGPEPQLLLTGLFRTVDLLPIREAIGTIGPYVWIHWPRRVT